MNIEVRRADGTGEWEGAPASDQPPIPFPVQAFPAPVADFVTETARSMGVSNDLVAAPVLPVLAASIGASWMLVVKHGFEAVPSLWVATIAPPGSGKTPASQAATGPLRTWQGRKLEDHRRELAEWSSRPDDPTRGHRPVPARVLVGDVTTEKLASLLSQNPRGLLFAQDELTALIGSFDQYRRGRGSDRSRFLEMWSSASITVDRQGNPDPIHVNMPVVSILGNLTPDMVSSLAEHSGRDDGFTDRFLMVEPMVQTPYWSDAEVTGAVTARYTAHVEALLDLQMENGHPTRLSLTKSAYDEWARLHNEHVDHIRQVAASARGPLAKMIMYAARLSLVLHVSRFVAGETESSDVDEKSVLRGWALVDYFAAHRYHAMSRQSRARSGQRTHAALSWLRKRELPATPRDLQRAGVAGVRTAEEANSLCDELVTLGAAANSTTATGSRQITAVGVVGVSDSAKR